MLGAVLFGIGLGHRAVLGVNSAVCKRLKANSSSFGASKTLCAKTMSASCGAQTLDICNVVSHFDVCVHLGGVAIARAAE